MGTGALKSPYFDTGKENYYLKKLFSGVATKFNLFRISLINPIAWFIQNQMQHFKYLWNTIFDRKFR